MSLHEYEMGREIEKQGYPFYALIQAAMRQADSDNIEKLRIAFPETWRELDLRYSAPGGRIEGDEHPKSIKIVEVEP